jgi:hypothetical protein
VRSSRWSVPLGSALGVLAVLLRLLLLRRRYFDTDELEHLHAALALAHGNVLYKSFFELHGPVFYWLLRPLAAAVAGPIRLIVAARVLMLGFWAIMLGAQWRTSREAPRAERVFGVLFLLFFTSFSLKSLEIRPDVPAAAILCGLLVLAERGDLGVWQPLGLGAGVGVGLLTSLKFVYPAAGLVAVVLVRAWRTPRALSFPRYAALLALGAAVPLALVSAVFASQDALPDLYRCYILFSLRFQRGVSPWHALLPSLLENPVLWAFAAWTVFKERRASVLVCTLAASLAGFAVVPSAYAQYFLFVGPMLAALAAKRTTGAAAASVALLSFAASLALHARALRQDNALQTERIRCVETMTAPGDRIVDTWSGESFHRPHAGYYWFWPEDVHAMLSAQAEPVLLASLSAPSTRGLIWSDTYMPQMPPSVQDYARAHYHAAGCGRLFLRNEEPPHAR